jgi:hypothetical protein
MANLESNFWGNGYNEVAFLATATSLTNAAMGIAQEFTASVTATLPPAAVGSLFAFRVGAPGLTVKVKPASTETFTGLGIATPTASWIATLANAPAGSTLIFQASSTTNWNIVLANLGGAARTVFGYAAT